MIQCYEKLEKYEDLVSLYTVCIEEQEHSLVSNRATSSMTAAFLRTLTLMGSPDLALKVLLEIQDSPEEENLNAFAYRAGLRACANLGDFQTASNLVEKMEFSGFYNTLKDYQKVITSALVGPRRDLDRALEWHGKAREEFMHQPKSSSKHRGYRHTYLQLISACHASNVKQQKTVQDNLTPLRLFLEYLALLRASRTPVVSSVEMKTLGCLIRELLKQPKEDQKLSDLCRLWPELHLWITGHWKDWSILYQVETWQALGRWQGDVLSSDPLMSSQAVQVSACVETLGAQDPDFCMAMKYFDRCQSTKDMDIIDPAEEDILNRILTTLDTVHRKAEVKLLTHSYTDAYLYIHIQVYLYIQIFKYSNIDSYLYSHRPPQLI